jgi:hypothetical protein
MPDADENPSPTVPLSITRKKFLRWFEQQGITNANVLTAIAGIEDPPLQNMVRDMWNHTLIFLRYHPLLSELGKALKISEQQIDQAFVEGQTL